MTVDYDNRHSFTLFYNENTNCYKRRVIKNFGFDYITMGLYSPLKVKWIGNIYGFNSPEVCNSD